jgi:hypothetical protein
MKLSEVFPHCLLESMSNKQSYLSDCLVLYIEAVKLSELMPCFW